MSKKCQNDIAKVGEEEEERRKKKEEERKRVHRGSSQNLKRKKPKRSIK